jgi:hypothetical protein
MDQRTIIDVCAAVLAALVMWGGALYLLKHLRRRRRLADRGARFNLLPEAGSEEPVQAGGTARDESSAYRP